MLRFQQATARGVAASSGTLSLFLTVVTKDTIRCFLRVRGSMNDKPVIFFQPGNSVLDISGRISVGVLVSNASESKDAANFTCGENGAPLAPPRLELNICPLGRSVEYNRE
jgi:hypothetical protein